MNIFLDLPCGACHNSNYSGVWHRKITSLKPTWATLKGSLKIKIQLNARNTTQWGEHLLGMYLIPITTKRTETQDRQYGQRQTVCVCMRACVVQKQQRDHGECQASYSTTLHLSLLKQNLELGWLPASARDPPSSTSRSECCGFRPAPHHAQSWHTHTNN